MSTRTVSCRNCGNIRLWLHMGLAPGMKQRADFTFRERCLRQPSENCSFVGCPRFSTSKRPMLETHRFWHAVAVGPVKTTIIGERRQGGGTHTTPQHCILNKGKIIQNHISWLMPWCNIVSLCYCILPGTHNSVIKHQEVVGILSSTTFSTLSERGLTFCSVTGLLQFSDLFGAPRAGPNKDCCRRHVAADYIKEVVKNVRVCTRDTHCHLTLIDSKRPGEMC